MNIVNIANPKKIINYLVNKLPKPKKISQKEQDELSAAAAAFPRVLSTSETLDRIINNKASICRFGDAEFGISNFEDKNDPYQKPSKTLTERLNKIILTASNDKLIIAIPPFNPKHNNTENYYKDISFWQWYWMTRYKKIFPLLVNREYGNSFVSRDAVFCENELETIKKIWDTRKVVFVVSKEGRFIFEPRLFDNIKNKKFIYIPATNAFEDYDRILKEAKRFPKDFLFLISAGPTATVLAYDLHQEGYQAVDIGHISNCYLQFLGEAGAPEALPMHSQKGKKK